MHVRFDHKQPEAAHITTYFFRPEQKVHYTAGQYIELTVPHENPDERGIKHWFTLSSSPTQELLSITTKHASDRSSTFKTTLGLMPEGTELHMSDPMGDFVLPKLVETPLIFVAGGIGITPFHSMLTWMHDVKESRPIQFLYAVKSEDEIVFMPTFEAAAIKPTIIVSEPSDAWGGERGRITAEKILSIGNPDEDALIYVSGPEPMVEGLRDDLKKNGFPDKRIVGDYFPGYPKF